jgi:hypothetical protein
VKDKRLPDGWYGGTKYLECDIAIGAFNHLELESLIQHLREIGGPFADELQLMVKEQEDSQFRIIDICPETSS